MAINPDLIDVTTIPNLPDGAFGLNNLLAQSNPAGVMSKNTQSAFVAFLAPYVAAVGSAAYAPTSSLALPTPSGNNSFTLVGLGTYTHSGGNVNATGDLNILNWNGSAWSLAFPIDVDLSDYAKLKDVYQSLKYVNEAVVLNIFNKNDPDNFVNGYLDFPSDYKFSGYMDVTGIDHVYINRTPVGRLFFYDEDYVQIGDYINPANNAEVPANAKYFRFIEQGHWLENDYKENLIVSNVPITITDRVGFGFTEKNVIELRDDIKKLISEIFILNLFNKKDPDNFVESYAPAPDFKYSGYIDVTDVEHIYINRTPAGRLFWYDEDFVQIGDYENPANNAPVRSGAKYFRYLEFGAQSKVYYDLIVVSDRPETQIGIPFGYSLRNEKPKYLNARKFVALGDSITYGEGNFGVSWFTKLTQRLNSVDSVNLAISGTKIRTMADALTVDILKDTSKVFFKGGTNRSSGFVLGTINDDPTPDKWKPSTVYSVGNKVQGGTPETNGGIKTYNYIYECTVGGTSDSNPNNADAFNTALDSISTDNGISWKNIGHATYYGDLKRIVYRVWTFNNSVEIIMLFPIRDTTVIGPSSTYRQSEADAMAEVCDYYAIRWFDMRKLFPVNQITGSAFMSDILHPNDAGYELICDIVMANI